MTQIGGTFACGVILRLNEVMDKDTALMSSKHPWGSEDATMAREPRAASRKPRVRQVPKRERHCSATSEKPKRAQRMSEKGAQELPQQ